MGFLNELFPSKEEKQVIAIYDCIDSYWKNTNNFLIAHVRYLQDLNFKFKLGFSDSIFSDLPTLILTPQIAQGISQHNAMFVFSQFVSFYIIRNNNPCIYRYSDENLLKIAENLTLFTTQLNSARFPDFIVQLDNSIDAIAIIKKIKLPEIVPNEKNKAISRQRLADNLKCSPDKLKETVFKQLSSMGLTIEAYNEVVPKFEKAKFEQAKQYGIHPEDTPAAILFSINEQYIETIRNKKGDLDTVIHEMSSVDPQLMTELLAAKSIGDDVRFNEILDKNPEFMWLFLRKLAEQEEGGDFDDDFDY